MQFVKAYKSRWKRRKNSGGAFMINTIETYFIWPKGASIYKIKNSTKATRIAKQRIIYYLQIHKFLTAYHFFIHGMTDMKWKIL